MQAIATAKNIRVSPKKVRLVVDQIKKLSPQEAVDILEFIPKGSSEALKKVIKSAIANAKNSSSIQSDALKFKEIQVGKGITFKRYRAISRGRAHSILKRTSQIRVILEADEPKNQKVQKTKKEQNLTSKETKVTEPKEAINGTKS